MPQFFGRQKQEDTAPRQRGVWLPGVPDQEGNRTMGPEEQVLLLNRFGQDKPIGTRELGRAVELLTQYKQGKANLENRVVEDELWWELRHWEALRRKRDGLDKRPEPASAWLFNAITNKHADAMDNYPEPVVLPRERSDEESAKTLSSILPVVMEYNDFEQTYSDEWWEKLKHGTAVYGVFWNAEKENGLGDIDITTIDLLKIFWEPGVTDIQKSRNLFIVDLVDEEVLNQQYPEHKGKMGGSVVDVKQYVYDDTIDVEGKSVVVDWYYKVKSASGKTVLHYVKFVGDTLLFASENDPRFRESGIYEHGMYPVVFDTMFPEKGTPVGFGYVAICKDPQMYIDKLQANILESSMMATRKRFFISSNSGVNKEQFLDWNEPLVEVEGELDDSRIREITTNTLSDIYVTVSQMKIEEMKDTASNRDVNSGGAGSGVTAAAAIAALQEAGNKASRDMIAASYRAYVAITTMCIERMRQFYDVSRSFRITGTAPGSYAFVEMNNQGLQDQPVEMATGETVFRRPVFDVKIKAQKKNPFSRMEQNERAKELYAAGFFAPERAQEAMGALDMMEFEGIDKVKEYVGQGQTLLNLCQQMQRQITEMSQVLTLLTGRQVGAIPDREPAQAPPSSEGGSSNGKGLAGAAAQAQTPMTDYGTRLAARSRPSMLTRSDGAKPQ